MKKTASILLLLLAGCTVAAEAKPEPIHPDPFTGITIPDEVPGPDENTGNTEESTPKTDEIATVQAPKIHVYGPDWCSVCKEIPDQERFIKHKEPFPPWVYERANKHGFPVLHWNNGTKWKATYGWYGEEELDRIIAGEPAAAVVGEYPVRGGWWTHPGTIWNHLVSHGYSEEYVRSLSYAEAMSLHSDHHEGRVKGNPPRAAVQRVMRRTYCPACPR